MLHVASAGISATSEDIPNKIEDLRSECSSDFGGKDSVTSPDGEDSAQGTIFSLAFERLMVHVHAVPCTLCFNLQFVTFTFILPSLLES